MTIYCDLNIIEASSYSTNLANIKQAVKLGYQIVAINRNHGSPKKLPKETNSKSEIAIMKQTIQKMLVELKQDKTLSLTENFQLLSRLTLTINNQEELNYLRGSYYTDMLSNFNLIAYNPTDEKIFKIIMTGRLTDIDIISFNLENKLDFSPSREMLGVGVSKEIAFEICYSPAIKSISLRKYIFHNGKMLVNKMKYGRGIVLCSGGEHVMDFRGPQDVANLANLFDLRGPACNEVVSKNCQKVVRHFLLRSSTFKGAVSVEKIDVSEPEHKKKKTS